MTICGLDFGTSNSTIGVLKNEQPEMVPLEQDSAQQWQTTLPSALFFAFEDDQINFGRHAIGRYTAGEPGRLMRSMKSVLGSSFMADSTQVKRKLYSYEEIIGFFIARLKQQAETFAGNSIDAVVLGRPVFFNDTNSDLDRAAQQHLQVIAQKAGFSEISFQFEPIAAALDYEQRVDGEELALIVDIGGGTSDFTIVRLSGELHNKADRQQDFLANNGVHIGGTDFDRRLAIAGVMKYFGFGVPLAERPSLQMPGHYYFDLATWHKIHLLYELSVLRELGELRVTLSDKQPIERLLALLKKRKGHQLAALVEQAKIDLSQRPQTRIDLPSLMEECAGLDNCVLTRQVLLESLERDLQGIFEALDVTLQQAGLNHDQITTVFTTGGSTALPMVTAGIEAAFPAAKIVAGDLYNSVGAGLLTEAMRRYR